LGWPKTYGTPAKIKKMIGNKKMDRTLAIPFSHPDVVVDPIDTFISEPLASRLARKQVFLSAFFAYKGISDLFPIFEPWICSKLFRD
jgi:hypothetical protein